MMQVFFIQRGVKCKEKKKTVKEKYKDDTCTFRKYHEEIVGHSSYSHTLPVDGVSSFKFKWPGVPLPHIHTKGRRQAENTASFIVWLIQFEDNFVLLSLIKSNNKIWMYY